MSILRNNIVINIAPSHKSIKRFKAAFPGSVFYGRATLGGKRNSYLIAAFQYTTRKNEIKNLKASKARSQPFMD
jgi:hypothetical protein